MLSTVARYRLGFNAFLRQHEAFFDEVGISYERSIVSNHEFKHQMH